MKFRVKFGRACWTAAVVYTLLLSYLTLTPDPWWFLGEPGKEAEKAFDNTFADYIQHSGAYLVLAVLFAAASSTTGRACILACGGLTLIHAVGSEWLQTYIPLRTCDWSDAAANLAGVICGWLATMSVLGYALTSSAPRRVIGASPDRSSTGR